MFLCAICYLLLGNAHLQDVGSFLILIFRQHSAIWENRVLETPDLNEFLELVCFVKKKKILCLVKLKEMS